MPASRPLGVAPASAGPGPESRRGPGAARSPRARWSAMDLSLIAVFAALMAASIAVPGVNIGPLGVAITLQTLVVGLCGLVLGFGRGSAAVGLYVLLGLVGLPIFSGFRAGPAVLASPSAGYIIGFIFAAAVVGLLAALAVRSRWRAVALFAAAMAGTVVVHLCGILGFMAKGMALQAAVAADLLYLPGDVLKNVVAVLIALSLHRAFPDLLVRRRR